MCTRVLSVRQGRRESQKTATARALRGIFNSKLHSLSRSLRGYMKSPICAESLRKKTLNALSLEIAHFMALNGNVAVLAQND
jgi:hypothetical protein